MVRFGLFTDVHYASGRQYGNRYCDASRDKLERAFEAFTIEGVPFVVNLGDVIDGAHGDGAAETDRANLREVAGIVQPYPGVVHHLLGNHDLESLTKREVLDELGAAQDRTWYSFVVGACTFVMLDASFRRDGVEYQRGNYEWTDTALSGGQMEWLQATLTESGTGPVVLFIHQNIDHRLWQGALDPHILTQAPHIRALLEHSGRQVIVFQGHYHPGYHQRIEGVDYVTLRAMCEGDGHLDNAYAIVTVEDDRSVIIRGADAQGSLRIPGPAAAQTA